MMGRVFYEQLPSSSAIPSSKLPSPNTRTNPLLLDLIKVSPPSLGPLHHHEHSTSRAGFHGSQLPQPARPARRENHHLRVRLLILKSLFPCHEAFDQILLIPRTAPQLHPLPRPRPPRPHPLHPRLPPAHIPAPSPQRTSLPLPPPSSMPDGNRRLRLPRPLRA